MRKFRNLLFIFVLVPAILLLSGCESTNQPFPTGCNDQSTAGLKRGQSVTSSPLTKGNVVIFSIVAGSILLIVTLKSLRTRNERV